MLSSLKHQYLIILSTLVFLGSTSPVLQPRATDCPGREVYSDQIKCWYSDGDVCIYNGAGYGPQVGSTEASCRVRISVTSTSNPTPNTPSYNTETLVQACPNACSGLIKGGTCPTTGADQGTACICGDILPGYQACATCITSNNLNPGYLTRLESLVATCQSAETTSTKTTVVTHPITTHTTTDEPVVHTTTSVEPPVVHTTSAVQPVVHTTTTNNVPVVHTTTTEAGLVHTTTQPTRIPLTSSSTTHPPTTSTTTTKSSGAKMEIVSGGGLVAVILTAVVFAWY